MTELSPGAQKVLDAFRTSHKGPGCLAAALRAVADQVVPQRFEIYRDEAERIDGDVRSDVRQDLLAIATELEAQ